MIDRGKNTVRRFLGKHGPMCRCGNTFHSLHSHLGELASDSEILPTAVVDQFPGSHRKPEILLLDVSSRGLAGRLFTRSRHLLWILRRLAHQSGSPREYLGGSREAVAGPGVGGYLVERGELSPACLERAVQECGGYEARLARILVERGFVSEETLYRAVAERGGYEFWRFKESDLDAEAGRLISKRFAETHRLLVLKIDSARKELVVAVSEPEDLVVSDLLRRTCEPLGLRLKMVVASPSSIRRGNELSTSSVEAGKTSPLVFETVPVAERHRSDLVNRSDIPGIKRILNEVLFEAAVEGASDVHIENLESEVRVRFRIDGILQLRHTPVSKENVEKVISVLKIESGLDITERRRPQDGVVRKRIGEDWFIDFRVHVHASQFGGDAVIRILDRTRRLPRLDQLGLPLDIFRRYRSLVQSPQGLILITGPTGSGKSTTLYSTLSYLNTLERKIVTAEDPVEYHLDGICQYQVNDSIGNSFSEYARRFLRKDPDIILVGETRDETTAAACLRAAMTGHLVFTTLHTNQTTSSVARLRDLKSDPSTICESLLAVLSQRLVRVVCRNCRQPYEPERRFLEVFCRELSSGTAGPFLRGIGCSSCHQTGYTGRIGVFELWELDARSRSGILNGQDEWGLVQAARESGTRPLILDAFSKVQSGMTTLEEVFRVVPMPARPCDR